MKKKAQTEIIGIVVIVIILVIAGFFMISQRLKKQTSPSDSFVDPKLAQSFLNVIMKTKTENNMKVSEMIQNCYKNRNDVCSSSTVTNCCEYAHDTIQNALEATLGEWQRSYRFTIERGSDKKIQDISTPGCDKFSEKNSQGFLTYHHLR